MIRDLLRALRRSPRSESTGPAAPRAPAPPRPRAARPTPQGPPEPAPPQRLVLYKYDSCGFCRRVHRAMQDLSVQVELRDTLKDPGAAKELRDATGRGQVPCLFIDGVPMFESADIIDWLQRYDSMQARNSPGPSTPGSGGSLE